MVQLQQQHLRGPGITRAVLIVHGSPHREIGQTSTVRHRKKKNHKNKAKIEN